MLAGAVVVASGAGVGATVEVAVAAAFGAGVGAADGTGDGAGVGAVRSSPSQFCNSFKLIHAFSAHVLSQPVAARFSMNATMVMFWQLALS